MTKNKPLKPLNSSLNKVSIGFLTSPLKQSFITALRRVDTAKDLVISLTSDCGKTGFGSATEVIQVTGETLESIESSLRDTIIPSISKTLENHLISPVEVSKELEKLLPKMSSARACFEAAYYDLYAKVSGKSLPDFLGHKNLSFNTCYTISLDSKENMLDQAKRVVAEGFFTLKVKLGHGNIDTDISCFDELIKNLPNEVNYRVDANQAWNREDSVKFIDRFENTKIQLIEQPVEKTKTEDLIYLNGYSKFPIFADESAFNMSELKRLESLGACKGVVLKLLKTGGIRHALEIIEFCKEADLEIMVSSMLETKLGVYTSLAVASTLEDH